MPNLTVSQLNQTLRTSLQEILTDRSAQEQSDLANAIARELITLSPQLTGLSDVERKRRIDKDLLSPDVSYAIPDDALNLAPTLTQAVIGAFTKGPAGAIADLVGLLIRYRSLRVEICEDEAAVLRALGEAKSAGQSTLSPAEIASRLQSGSFVLRQPIGDVLASLLAKKTEKATLVREVNGRWAIGNV